MAKPSRPEADAAAELALDMCHALSHLSCSETGIDRRYLSPEHQACNQQVAEWMQAAGMNTWQDAVGNQWGRVAASVANAPRLILGSHLDTVPNAGAYDGILGVTLGIELARWWAKQPVRPFHLDLVGFCDEEGTRFGVTLIGSRALANNFDPSWLDVRDSLGISMAQALTRFGLDPNQVHTAALAPEDIIGFWEVHIEQGPVLEAQNLSLGVVTGIAGARRGQLQLSGCAGHAGTTPMNLRRDALCGAAEVLLAVEQLAGATQGQCVATVGQINAAPGAVNVIPGEVKLSLDVRSLDDSARDNLIAAIESSVASICSKRALNANWSWHHKASATACNSEFQNLFSQALTQNDLPVLHLPSGAGHDAMALAQICPMSMLFIRSPAGLSHHPDESVIPADVADVFRVICEALELLAHAKTT